MWQIRPDLELVPAEAVGGRPALLVHDPVSGTFDRVEWPESDLLLLLRERRSPGELVEAFRKVNPLRPTEKDVQGYLVALGRRGWLRDGRFFPKRFPAGKRGVMALFARSLFIQIPLLQPEAFLRRTMGVARCILSPVCLVVFLLCGVAGLYLALPRWEEYWRDSFGSFVLGQVPAFVLALIVVKALHEFAHAYAATVAGARVTSMGVAFFLLMPLPFTDVTDAWRLPWRKRLEVAAAGMLAETALAGVCLLLWALSPPGGMALLLARLSSLAVLSTLLTNLNPGPRFDGYYVLTCLFRMENLRSRSVAALRGRVWNALLGSPLPPPEPGMTVGRQVGMVVYAVYAVMYRVSLGVGIAVMAWMFLPRAVAIPVVLAEVWLFLGKPVVTEIVAFVRQGRKGMRVTPAGVLVVLLLGGFVVWAAGSWPRRVRFPAVTRADTEEAVRTLREGVVSAVFVGRGSRVAEGQVIARLESDVDGPLLRGAEAALDEARLAEAQAWRGDRAGRDAVTRGAEIRRREVELGAVRNRERDLDVASPVEGVLATWAEEAVPGVPVGRGRTLGMVTAGQVTTLSCYPDIETAGKIEAGSPVRFFPDDGGGWIPGVIARIDESRPEVLEDAPLAAVLGGEYSGGMWLLPAPYAKVTVVLDASHPRIGQTGEVLAWSRPESLVRAAWLWLRGLAVRESAF